MSKEMRRFVALLLVIIGGVGVAVSTAALDELGVLAKLGVYAGAVSGMLIAHGITGFSNA